MNKFCGIDLHSNNSVVVVSDEADRVVYQRRLPNDAAQIRAALKGEGNTKNGNRYLAWAFVEAANFAIRTCPEARRFYERKKRARNGIVAIKALVHHYW